MVMDELPLGVGQDAFVHEEADGHLHRLAGLQHLHGEAEALDLGEIAARRVGRDVEAGLPGDPRSVGLVASKKASPSSPTCNCISR